MRDEEAYFVLVCASALDGRALLVRKTRIILLFKIRIDIESQSLTERFDRQLRALALVGILRCE